MSCKQGVVVLLSRKGEGGEERGRKEERDQADVGTPGIYVTVIKIQKNGHFRGKAANSASAVNLKPLNTNFLLCYQNIVRATRL